MTDRDVTELKGDVKDIKSVLEDLVQAFRIHVAVEEASDEVRAKTCPHSVLLNKLKSDIDAVAGIVRSHGEFIREHQDNKKFITQATIKQLFASSASLIEAVTLVKWFGI